MGFLLECQNIFWISQPETSVLVRNPKLWFGLHAQKRFSGSKIQTFFGSRHVAADRVKSLIFLDLPPRKSGLGQNSQKIFWTSGPETLVRVKSSNMFFWTSVSKHVFAQELFLLKGCFLHQRPSSVLGLAHAHSSGRSVDPR